MKKTLPEEFIQKAIQEKIFPGCVIGLCTAKEKSVTAFGTHTYGSNAIETTVDTIYDIASITKIIPTGCLAWKLMEQGLLRLDDPAQRYLPAWRGRFAEQVTIRHLLSQAVLYDLPSLSSFKELSAEKLRAHILHTNLIESPGKRYFYQNTTSILLGWIIENVRQESLAASAEKLFWQPLQLHDTGFAPVLKNRSSLAPTEQDSWRKKLIHGEVHDESAWVLSQQGEVVGSAGLFSTAPDLLIFLQMLLRKGEYQGAEIFRPTTIEEMFTPIQLEEDQRVGLGWEYNAEWMGRLPAPAFGKTGFTGCFCLLLPKKDFGFIFLSNTVHPHRKERAVFEQFRSNFLQALLTEL